MPYNNQSVRYLYTTHCLCKVLLVTKVIPNFQALLMNIILQWHVFCCVAGWLGYNELRTIWWEGADHGGKPLSTNCTWYDCDTVQYFAQYHWGMLLILRLHLYKVSYCTNHVLQLLFSCHCHHSCHFLFIYFLAVINYLCHRCKDVTTNVHPGHHTV